MYTVLRCFLAICVGTQLLATVMIAASSIGGCGVALAQPDTWLSKPNLAAGIGAPAHREQSCAVWTGARLIVWAGARQSFAMNSGGVYDPATDSWEARPNLNAGIGAPTPRVEMAAVWTGTRLVVWGGLGGVAAPVNAFVGLNDGGVYDLASDTWIASPGLNSGNRPSARTSHTFVWTGTTLIVYGGSDTEVPVTSAQLRTGGLYDPVTDSWLSRPNLQAGFGAPDCGRNGVWTGSRMVVWGGTASNASLSHFGGAYDPVTDTWMSTPNMNAGINAPAIIPEGGLWTGSSYLTWGRDDGPAGSAYSLHRGATYDLITDAWTRPAVFYAGSGGLTTRQAATMRWTGTFAWIWCGLRLQQPATYNYLNDGALYHPASDSWVPAPNLNNSFNAPPNRRTASSVWTGTHMIVWGGRGDQNNSQTEFRLNDGGIYEPPAANPIINSNPPLTAEVDKPYSYTVTNLGVSGTVNASGLPSWLSLSGKTLSGTPTRAFTGTTSNILITVTSAYPPAATQSYTLTVTAPPLFTAEPPSAAMLGTLYEYIPTVDYYPGPLSISKVSGPSWLLSDGTKLFGTPPTSSVGQTFSVTVSAYNPGFAAVLKTWDITVGYSPYDVNRSGGVTVADVQLAANIVIGIATPSYQGQGNVDGDSKTNVIDVQKIVNKILNP